MSETYAIADLHGRFDLLVKALSAIESHESQGTIVFLGDYIDRGPNSRQVLERLIAGPPAGWRWVCLKGNHEEMMVDAIRKGEPAGWLVNGGYETIQSYGGNPPEDHIRWCDELPMIHLDDHRAYVHAGVDPHLPLNSRDQGSLNLLWRRYRDDEEVCCERHIIHGHTPNSAGPVRLAGRTNLDTGAVFYGRLVVGVFANDVPGGPVELIAIS